ncbi:MAG TPA: TlpA disulfide reductase family protein [Anaerolineales bacterium]|nr:TlpA disulfide reductase family protein [Anaerolineales bacterium]
MMVESKSDKQTLKALPLILVGLGLTLAAVSTYFILQDAEPQTNFLTVPVKVNYDAPGLTLTDIHGVEHSISDYRGQVVLVNLWATWCIPCKEEMPALQSFYDDNKDKGFTVIAINDGDLLADVAKFAEDYDLTFPIWLDPTYTATEQAFKTMNLPSSFLIDQDGTVQLLWVGGISRAMLEEHVTPFITEKP